MLFLIRPENKMEIWQMDGNNFRHMNIQQEEEGYFTFFITFLDPQKKHLAWVTANYFWVTGELGYISVIANGDQALNINEPVYFSYASPRPRNVLSRQLDGEHTVVTTRSQLRIIVDKKTEPDRYHLYVYRDARDDPAYRRDPLGQDGYYTIDFWLELPIYIPTNAVLDLLREIRGANPTSQTFQGASFEERFGITVSLKGFPEEEEEPTT